MNKWDCNSCKEFTKSYWKTWDCKNLPKIVVRGVSKSADTFMSLFSSNLPSFETYSPRVQLQFHRWRASCSRSNSMWKFSFDGILLKSCTLCMIGTSLFDSLTLTYSKLCISMPPVGHSGQSWTSLFQ